MIAPIREQLEKYNVVWDSRSKDASGSMPIGNGYFGANVWVEPNGDVLLLLATNDAWDENGSLLKLGRLRLKLSPNPFQSNSTFRQELDLHTATIELHIGDVSMRIWSDWGDPVIRIEAFAKESFEISAQLEIWRTQERVIKTQTSDLFKNLAGPDPFPTVVSPDHILSGSNRIIWCHHNQRRQHDAFEINMRLQGLGAMIEKIPHPLMGRTFGGAVDGEGFALTNSTTLRSTQARREHKLWIWAHTKHPTTIEEWKQSVNEMFPWIMRQFPNERARSAHELWWDGFWQRGWIWIDSPDAYEITQAYVLQRFMNACAGRAYFPVKHNGSIFSYGKPDDPDFRRWGGPGWWFMNQRLIYWPMLAAGDFDLMIPWLRMYRDSLELQKHRTRTYFKHGGAHYPETIMFWGAEVSGHYGWQPFEERASPEAECAYLRYYWSGGIELTLILLEYLSYTGGTKFLDEFLLPIADAVTEFYDLHYPRDANGKIRFEPAQALETWHEAVNPLPEIAGLRYVLPKLLELPIATEQQKARWTRMLSELPEIPIGEKGGKRVILPAETFDKKKNTENPELYSIFPYRLHGVGKPDLQLARDTFEARLHKSHECWSQDEIQMALLGLIEQAKESLLKRAAPDQHSDSRFPAFWNSHKDWCPDMDHGGVLSLALQYMLMQCQGREIRLLPAWPREWDVDFKLHAPFQTIVECSVREGKIVELKVTPESRRSDVVTWSFDEEGFRRG